VKAILCLTYLCLFSTAAAASSSHISTSSTVMDEVFRTANTEIKRISCESSEADPRLVTELVPQSNEVAEGNGITRFAVLWSGQLGCGGGSGSTTMNITTLEKRGESRVRIIDTDIIVDAASIEHIVASAPDSLTIDVYTWGPDDAHCCPGNYERWTLKRSTWTKSAQRRIGEGWKVASTKEVEPPASDPNENKLPTALMNR
jgi:hypothetical protein